MSMGILIAFIFPLNMFPIYVEEPEPMVVEMVDTPEVEAKIVESETYIITAYTAGLESTGKSPGHPQYGITTSGKYVKEGVTAACPEEIPFGTVIEIEGLGERVCHDRGGAIKGNRIDVYMSSVHDALAFGVQKLEVRIVSE